MSKYCINCESMERELNTLRDLIKWQQSCSKMDQDHINSICRKLGQIEGLITCISTELYLVNANRPHPSTTAPPTKPYEQPVL